MKKTATFFVALVLFVIVSNAHGLTFTATGSGNSPGQTNSATVTFTEANNQLIITLSNTATYDPNNANDILTGIFFKLALDDKLTPVSAVVGSDDSVIGHPLPAGFTGDVGGEWAYRNDLTKAPGGANEGISSTNLKWFGSKKYLFPGDNLAGGKSPGGVDFGLTTLNDLPGNDKGNIKRIGLIEETVTFTFNLPADVTLASISDVTFQYGKTLKSAEEITGEQLALIPEPSTMLLAAAGLLGVVALGRRKITRG